LIGLCLSFWLGAVLALPVFAQTPTQAPPQPAQIPAATRVAVVDMKRVIDSAPQFTAAKTRAIAELAGIETRLKADEAALAGLKRRRDVEAGLMSKAQLDALVRTIEVSERALKRGRDDFNQRMSLRINEVARELERKLSEVIGVISVTATVYTNPKLDITDAVLAKLRAGLQ
jgi:Skp family chaperone for outer membrane proteins